MSKVKKLLAIILSMAMILGMSLTTFAANGTPEAADTAKVSITDLSGNPTVTLYQIASAVYGSGDREFIRYNWAEGATFANPSEPTANEINAIAQGLTAEEPTIEYISVIGPEKVNGTTYEKTVSAGAYIAIITGAEDNTVYNPILLTATYGESGNLVEDPVSATETYLHGSTAVAKSTKPSIDKEITSGSTLDGERNTASVGDVLTYTITPTIPDYPSNATNKTFFISDTMTAGLTFDYSSLTVEISGQKVTKSDNNFLLNDKIIATAYNTEKGFNLNFNYDYLISNSTTGAVYQPIVTYQAIVNGNAVVGGTGNTNNAELYYANNPNSGQTWNTAETKPGSATGTTSTTDTETVYTYQLGFQKVDSANKATKLQDAVFGIYSDSDCNELVDMVTTNKNGYAFSTNVAAGTYYIKELVAPRGYSLSEVVTQIQVSWTTATTTVTGTVTDSTYTTVRPSDDSVQVGWIKNDIFYSMDAVDSDTAADHA